MVLNDPLANFYSKMLNSEKSGKEGFNLKISSNVIKKNLEILQKNGYVKEFKEVKITTTPELNVTLSGNINKCGVIKPRLSVKITDYEKYEKRFLPAKGFGIILVSTSKGLLTHDEAKEKGLGGRLIAYCY